jgi:hypothetical protein
LLAFGVGVIWGSHKYAWVMSKKAKRDEEKAEKVKKQREQYKQIQAENLKLRSENDELKKLLSPSQLELYKKKSEAPKVAESSTGIESVFSVDTLDKNTGADEFLNKWIKFLEDKPDNVSSNAN